jgi:hypothetical protein
MKDKCSIVCFFLAVFDNAQVRHGFALAPGKLVFGKQPGM